MQGFKSFLIALIVSMSDQVLTHALGLVDWSKRVKISLSHKSLTCCIHVDRHHEACRGTAAKLQASSMAMHMKTSMWELT